jgi:hypothetical protein
LAVLDSGKEHTFNNLHFCNCNNFNDLPEEKLQVLELWSEILEDQVGHFPIKQPVKLALQGFVAPKDRYGRLQGRCGGSSIKTVFMGSCVQIPVPP